MKEDIEELSEKLGLLANTIKILGDDLMAEEVMRTHETRAIRNDEIKKAASELLHNLQRIGTVR